MPSQFNPVHAPIPVLEDPFEYYLPTYAWVSQVVAFPQEEMTYLLVCTDRG
jgi:hypothetical protein